MFTFYYVYNNLYNVSEDSYLVTMTKLLTQIIVLRQQVVKIKGKISEQPRQAQLHGSIGEEEEELNYGNKIRWMCKSQNDIMMMTLIIIIVLHCMSFQNCPSTYLSDVSYILSFLYKIMLG